MPYSINDNSPAARHAQAAAGVNTLGNTSWSGAAPSDNIVPDVIPSTTNGRPTLYWPNGQPITDQDFANIRKYGSALADEDARRFEVGQSNVVAARQQTAQEHADQVKQAKQLLKQRQYEFNQNFGLDQQRFGEGQRQFNVNTGLDLLKTGASLRGPLDAFQGAAYARGVQTGGLAPYLQGLTTGGTTNLAGGTATTGNPTPLTLSTLSSDLTGSGGPAGQVLAQAGQPAGAGVGASGAATDAYGRPALTGDYATNLAGINTVAQRGLSNLGLGALENLSPGEMGTFKSGLDYLGRSTPDELAAYQRSRPGQGSALAA